jgi:hypothetical protein
MKTQYRATGNMWKSNEPKCSAHQRMWKGNESLCEETTAKCTPQKRMWKGNEGICGNIPVVLPKVNQYVSAED